MKEFIRVTLHEFDHTDSFSLNDLRDLVDEIIRDAEGYSDVEVESDPYEVDDDYGNCFTCYSWVVRGRRLETDAEYEQRLRLEEEARIRAENSKARSIEYHKQQLQALGLLVIDPKATSEP